MAPRGVLWPWGSRSRLCVGTGTEKLLTRCTLGLATELHHGPGVYRGPGSQGQGQGQGHMLEL